jgi:hypothetical protein
MSTLFLLTSLTVHGAADPSKYFQVRFDNALPDAHLTAAINVSNAGNADTFDLAPGQVNVLKTYSYDSAKNWNGKYNPRVIKNGQTLYLSDYNIVTSVKPGMVARIMIYQKVSGNNYTEYKSSVGYYPIDPKTLPS